MSESTPTGARLPVRRLHRPTRTSTPLPDPAPIEVTPPPTLSSNVTTTPFQFLLPVVGALTSVTMMVVMRNGQPLFMLLAGVVFVVALVSGVGFAVSSQGREAKKLRLQRARYLDYLERLRLDVRERAETTRSAAEILHPTPEGLITFIHDPERLWERRRGDSDHLQARIGVARTPWFTFQLSSSGSPIEPTDPILEKEAQLVADTYSSIEAMPALLRLKDAAVVAIIGPRERTVPLTRGIILNLATHQIPEDLDLALAFPRDHAEDWHGFDLLPHVHNPDLFDGPVPARRVAPTLADLSEILSSEMVDRSAKATAARRRGVTADELPRMVVVADEHGQAAGTLRRPDQTLQTRDLGITVIHLLDDRLDEPDDVDVRIDLREECTLTEEARSNDPTTFTFTPEETPGWVFESVARASLTYHPFMRTMSVSYNDGSTFNELEDCC